MNSLLIPPIVLSSVIFYVSVFHLLIYLKRPQHRENLTFALSCICVGMYALFCTGLYSANSPQEGMWWQRGQMVVLALASIALLWFVVDYTGFSGRNWIYSFSAFFLFAAVFGALDRSGVVWLTDQPLVKTITFPFYYQITYYEITPGPFIYIQEYVSFGFILYSLWIGVRSFQNKNQKKVALFVFATTCVFASAINDMAVNSGFYSFIYLLEYSFMAFIMLMTFSIANTVVNAAAAKEERDRMFNLSVDIMCVTGLDGSFKQANDACIRFLGWTGHQLLDKSWFDFIHPKDRAITIQTTKRLHAGNPVLSLVNRYRRHDGVYRWLSWNSFPIIKDNLIFSMARDITEQKQVETALEESEQLYRSAIEVAGAVPYYQNYKTGSYEFVGPGIEQMTGYPADGFNCGIWDCITREVVLLGKLSNLSHEEAIQAARKGEGISWRADYRIETRTGEERWVANAAVQVQDDQGDNIGSLGILQDITERKQAENALRESENRFRTLVDNTPIGVWQCDAEGQTIYVNPSMCSMLEIENANELTGVSWKSFFTPESLHTIAQHHQKRLQGSASTYEVNIIGKNGKQLDVLVCGSPLLSTTGELLGTLGTFLDLTERRHLENQLRQAQKMEAVGQLAGGIAHDFNNLLTVILGNITLAKHQKSGETCQFLQNAQNAADRAANLIRQLLAFSRKTNVDLKTVNLNDVLTEVSHLARQTIDRRIEISVHTEENLPLVRVDSAQVNSVLMNICVNARDAINEVMNGRIAPERRGDRFVISMETKGAVIDQNYCEHYSFAKPGRFVVVSVTDNGMGMDEETQRRIFEPFFTTKEIGEGTGLGLASVYGIVKQHGGWINVYSEAGKGTTFKIYFPVTKQESIKKPSKRAEEITGGSETILLVDDEQLIREFAQTILEQYGYNILLANDGKESIDIYLKERDRIDLIILDLSMPQMSGREVLEQLMSMSPEVKVIISSGYAEDSIKESLIQLGAVGYLSKPYQTVDMIRAVREALDTNDDNPTEMK